MHTDMISAIIRNVNLKNYDFYIFLDLKEWKNLKHGGFKEYKAPGNWQKCLVGFDFCFILVLHFTFLFGCNEM